MVKFRKYPLHGSGEFVLMIGHPAYTGINGRYYCESKADAVRELRARGVRRDDARDAVFRAMHGTFAVCHTPEWDVIEVSLNAVNVEQARLGMLLNNKVFSYQ